MTKYSEDSTTDGSFQATSAESRRSLEAFMKLWNDSLFSLRLVHIWFRKVSSENDPNNCEAICVYMSMYVWNRRQGERARERERERTREREREKLLHKNFGVFFVCPFQNLWTKRKVPWYVCIRWDPKAFPILSADTVVPARIKSFFSDDFQWGSFSNCADQILFLHHVDRNVQWLIWI